MEHLSAEERACLMYLEETIEALEVQEDSGLSNDEPDHGMVMEMLTTTLAFVITHEGCCNLDARLSSHVECSAEVKLEVFIVNCLPESREEAGAGCWGKNVPGFLMWSGIKYSWLNIL